MKLINKIQMAINATAGVLVVVGGVSIWAFSAINHQVGTIYDDRVIPLQQLKIISDDYAVQVIDEVNKTHAGISSPSQAVSSIKKAQEEIDKQWTEYRKTVLTDEEKQLADQSEGLFKAANDEINKVVAALESGNVAALAKFDGSLYKVIDPLTDNIKELSDLQLKVAQEERAKASSIYMVMNWVLILLIITTVLAIIFFVGPFVNKLIVGALKDAVNTIASTSTEIAAAAEEQERLAERQAASVNKTTTTMDELKVSAQQSAQQAETAALGANQVMNLSNEGKKALVETLEGMGDLKEKVNSISQAITQLNQQLSQIDTYQQIVAEIADQTNMLALNASVEAVRAGEQGKGFAVVANEIRKLADQSKQSADKINVLIVDIQKALQTTVKATQGGTQTVEEEVKIAQRMADTLTSVANSIDEVTVSVQQIALNAKQQAVGVEQVVDEMNLLNQSSAQTASGISQTKVGTLRLQEKASELKAMV